MKYTVYRITNTINGKIYIGTHQTKDLDDNYMGSGVLLKRAISKYGIENFTKEILHIFDNPEDMFDMEATLVNEDFVSDENTYNLKEGGSGGWNDINKAEKNVPIHKQKFNRTEHARLANEKRKWLWENDPEWRKEYSEKMSRAMKGKKTFLGHNHTEETKRKIGEANAKNTGPKNSQYGTMWITNEIESKKISKSQPIPYGWRKGRKMKVQ